ncbi:MAG: hypothetical protein V4630_18055 [Pseudomonadota bacterium]
MAQGKLVRIVNGGLRFFRLIGYYSFVQFKHCVKDSFGLQPIWKRIGQRNLRRLIGLRGVEITCKVTHNPDFYSFDSVQSGVYGEAPFFDICERLLTGGDDAWVRIVLRDDAFANDKAETCAGFVLVRAADCHAFSIDFPAKGSTCIRFAPDDGQPAPWSWTFRMTACGKTGPPPHGR